MRENYVLHKLHSLSGIVPVGYYLVQHLALNTFSLAGADAFNSIIHFFEGMPAHIKWAMKIGVVWIPLIFHAVYGLVITHRADDKTWSNPAYRYKENRYFVMQRVTGILAAAFLVYHMATTSIAAAIHGAERTIYFENWAAKLAEPNGTYLILVVYMLGVAVCSYHFGYGVWNFCIRWGITISERSQQAVAKASAVMAIAITLMGWIALFGFFAPVLQKDKAAEPVITQAPRESNAVSAETRP